MELSGVPKAVMPRAITAISRGNKRNDDTAQMSQHETTKGKTDANLSQSANAASDANRDARATGMSGMKQLARRLKIEHESPTSERSLPHKQELRARAMREKLTQTYVNDAPEVNKSRADKQTRLQNEQNAAVEARKTQSEQRPHSQPIHLIA